MFKTSSVLTRLMAVRCLSLLFGVLAVVATFAAARLSMDSRALAVAAAVIVAMQPMESQQTIAVNNDAAVLGLSAAIFYLQIRFLTKAPALPSPGAVALLVALCVLNVYAKPIGYAMLPGCLVLAGLIVPRHLKTRRAWTLVGTAFGVLLIAGVVFAVWRYRGAVAPGVAAAPATFPNFYEWVTTLDSQYKTFLFRSSWGQFGWLDHSIADEWLDRILYVGGIAFVGLATVSVMAVLLPEACRWFSLPALVFSVGTAVFAVAFVLFAEYRFRTAGLIGVIQGRNFLFGLPAFAIAVAITFGALVPARHRGFSAAALATCAVAVNLVGLHTILWFHYAG
jgi:hypothetical protein